jgi:hypothetical protein
LFFARTVIRENLICFCEQHSRRKVLVSSPPPGAPSRAVQSRDFAKSLHA